MYENTTLIVYTIWEWSRQIFGIWLHHIHLFIPADKIDYTYCYIINKTYNAILKVTYIVLNICHFIITSVATHYKVSRDTSTLSYERQTTFISLAYIWPSGSM